MILAVNIFVIYQLPVKPKPLVQADSSIKSDDEYLNDNHQYVSKYAKQ